MTRRFVLLVLGVGIGLFPLSQGMAQTTPPAPVWQARYDGGYLYGYGPGQGSDYPTRIVTDAVGNSYVTGQSSNTQGWDFATIKYDPNGTQLWVARYTGGAPTALVVDQAGNVYVGGSTGYAYVTVKYDAAGSQLWVKQYSSFYGTHLTALAVDGAGNVYVTGSVGTIKYAADGTQLWVRAFCVGVCGADVMTATGLGVDAAGNVYVTGRNYNGTLWETATVKYDTDGTQLWARRYNRGGHGYAIALRVDGAGNVYIAGSSSTGALLTLDTYISSVQNSDITLLKYDTEGNFLWEQIYDGGYADKVRDMALDGAGNIYLAGGSQRQPGGFISHSDWVTLKYRADGVQEWVARYVIPGGYGPYAMSFGSALPGATDLTVDHAGNVYVTGTRCLLMVHNIKTTSPFTYNCVALAKEVTIKYNPSGAPLWTVPAGNDLTVDDSGNLYVTTKDGTDYLTTKYAASNQPDLVMVALSTATTQIVAGETIHLSNTVLNNGAAPVGAFTIAFSLSGDAVYGGPDDIAFSPTRPVSALGAGASSAAATSLIVPTIALYGVYYLCAMADAGSAVSEFNETNNTRCTTTPVTGPPDLVMTALSTTATAVAPGGTLSLSNTVQNAGSGGAGTFTLAFHLSTNTVYGDADDVASVTTRTVPGLGAGASSAATTSVSVPTTTPLGAYYVCAMADSGAVMSETDEGNNTRCTPATIVVGQPDLVMTQMQLNAATANEGAILSVTDTVANSGTLSAGIFTIAWRLSSNTVCGDSDDVVMATTFSGVTTRILSSLAVGASHQATTSLVIPLGTVAGSYYVCGMADSANAVVESNETNNTRRSATQVTVPPPDLVMTLLSTTATAVAPGGTLALSNTVQNAAGHSAGAFSIAFRLSTNTIYGDADDVASVTTRAVTYLSWWASSLATTSVSVPAATPLGSYYLCALADSANAVTESNETNNSRCSSTTVTVTTSRLSNISTRAYVGTGGNVEIGGFIITGTSPKTVLIRARGPSMGGTPFNVPGTLANPYVQLYSFGAGAYIASQDNWQTAASCSAGYTCSGPPAGLDPCQPNPGQTTAPPGCAYEAAFQMTLPPGNYGAIVSGVGGGVGVGLVEVFELSQ